MNITEVMDALLWETIKTGTAEQVRGVCRYLERLGATRVASEMSRSPSPTKFEQTQRYGREWSE